MIAGFAGLVLLAMANSSKRLDSISTAFTIPFLLYLVAIISPLTNSRVGRTEGVVFRVAASSNVEAVVSVSPCKSTRPLGWACRSSPSTRKPLADTTWMRPFMRQVGKQGRLAHFSAPAPACELELVLRRSPVRFVDEAPCYSGSQALHVNTELHCPTKAPAPCPSHAHQQFCR
jgi:hypothetical protein